MSDLIIRAEGNDFRLGRRYFVLEEDNCTIRPLPVVCEADFIGWQKQACGRYRVDHALVSEKPEVMVVTLFLGHDDEPPESPPQPWATIVWGGPLNNRLWQYTTLGKAKQGHWQVVDLV